MHNLAGYPVLSTALHLVVMVHSLPLEVRPTLHIWFYILTTMMVR